MSISAIIPVVSQLLTLGFKLSEIVDKSKSVSPEDKAAMKKAIKAAQDGVKYWTETPLPEDGPVMDNG